jgi:hypothetical protein
VPLLHIVAGTEADNQIRFVATIQITSEKEPPLAANFGLRDVAKEQEASSDDALNVNGKLLNVRGADMRHP